MADRFMRQRLALFTTMCLVAVTLIFIVVARRGAAARVRTRRTVPHAYDFWRYRLAAMPDHDFHRFFRVPRAMLRMIARGIVDDVACASHALAHPVELLVAVAVWRLAHGSTLKLVASQFDIGEATVDAASWLVLPYIARTYRKEWIAGLWPDTEAKRRVAAKFYRERIGCRMNDVVGCIDGTHIPVSPPSGMHPEAFFCFKQFYSMLFLHVCDHFRRHMYIAGAIPGAAGDNTILAQSTLYHQLTARVPAPYHLLGDGGIPLRPQIMIPYPNPRNGGAMTSAMVKFNARLSNARVLVEQACPHHRERSPRQMPQRRRPRRRTPPRPTRPVRVMPPCHRESRRPPSPW